MIYFTVFLVIPFRQREDHLNQFLRVIHPFLQAQNIRFKFKQISFSKYNKSSTNSNWIL